jgi:hypothetical protein
LLSSGLNSNRAHYTLPLGSALTNQVNLVLANRRTCIASDV